MPQVKISIPGTSGKSHTKPPRKGSGKKIGYEFPFDGFTDVTKDFKGLSSEEQIVSVAARLLAKQREFALDHERGGLMYHGAALVRTKRGRWYLQANIHLPNAETTRNCAETNAITEARGREGERLEVVELYYTGGDANYEAGQPFVNNEGTHSTPCGSCRDVIYNNRLKVSGETVVHNLPLTDGKTPLVPGNPDDPRDVLDMAPNEVFTRRISQLLPHVSKVLDDRDGKTRAVMLDGYRWLQDPSVYKTITEAMLNRNMKEIRLHETDGSTLEEKMASIRKALAESAREYYQDADFKPHKLSVAIVRTTEGKYFIERYANNGEVLATSNAAVKAIGSMVSASTRNKITDVFYGEFDEKQMEDLMRGLPPKLMMTDGATSEIVKKAGPKNGAANNVLNLAGRPVSERGVMVHVFAPNDPRSNDFDPAIHVVSLGVHELLPYAYKNPKADRLTR